VVWLLWSTSKGAIEVFPPQQGEALRELTRQRPDLHGFPRSRWRLQDLRDAPFVPWLKNYSLPGICQALRRLKVKRKHGRLHVHSPDLSYHIKMAWIRRAHQLAQAHPERVSVLYGDELTFYRRPSLAGGGSYYPCAQEPLFETVPAYNTQHRVGAAMDAYTGRVVYVDDKVVGVRALCLLFERIRQAYGKERTIFLIWDNWHVWHVHYQKEVAAKAYELNIQLLWLPTYAPWTNPIEKMWRWLKQEHIHNHTLAAEFDILKERVRAFLRDFATATGSTDLLRYVGLLPNHDPNITVLTC